MSLRIRNKWLAIGGVVAVLAGVQRIVEWYLYGYAEQHGRHMPEATGIHALVSGAVVLLLGVWMAFASTREKSAAPEPRTPDEKNLD